MYKSERLEIRLGPKDMELLDIAAKIQGCTRSAMIRSLIRGTADWHQDDDVVASGILGPPVESPLTEQMPEVPVVEAAPVSTNEFTPEPLHRHKRGTLIETKWVKGQKVNSYRCAHDSCTYVMED